MCTGIFQSAVGKSLLAEFLSETYATFVFTVVAGLTYGVAGGLFASVGVGLAAIFLHQSERAHLNPIISIAVALSDIEFGWVHLALRILAQILGAILGGLLSVDTWREEMLNFDPASTAFRVLIYEFVFASVLVIVYLRTRGRSVLAPVVQGFVYFVAILCSSFLFVAGNVLLNPAVAIGLVIGSSAADARTEEGHTWKFVVGPFIGALLGVIFFQLTNALDDTIEETDDEGSTTMVKTTVYENRMAPAQPVQPVQRPRGSGY